MWHESVQFNNIGKKEQSAILCVSQVLDGIQIDNNFSEFADSITLRRIQENSSAGHGGEVWQITADLSAPGSSRSVDKAGLMKVSGGRKKTLHVYGLDPFLTFFVFSLSTPSPRLLLHQHQ